MNKHIYFIIMTIFCFLNETSLAIEDKVELETTYIKGNKELPQVLYVVPWKDLKKEQKSQETIILHSLFGNIFDPVEPGDINYTPDK